MNRSFFLRIGFYPQFGKKKVSEIEKSAKESSFYFEMFLRNKYETKTLINVSLSQRDFDMPTNGLRYFGSTEVEYNVATSLN